MICPQYHNKFTKVWEWDGQNNNISYKYLAAMEKIAALTENPGRNSAWSGIDQHSGPLW